MNWSLIAWVAGTLLTFAGIKFVFRLIGKLFSKDSMDSVINGIGQSCENGVDNITSILSRKMEARRQKKQEEKPVITIR